MTLWEFQACYDGWKEANKSESESLPVMDDETAASLGIDGF